MVTDADKLSADDGPRLAEGAENGNGNGTGNSELGDLAYEPVLTAEPPHKEPHHAPGAGAGAAADTRIPYIVIRPVSNWAWHEAREIWRARELLIILALRDIQIRYKQTILGAAWAILQPLMLMVVFTLMLGRLANRSNTLGLEGAGGTEIPYALFVLAGLLPWTFFSTTVTSAAASVIGNERLVTKVYFPRLVIPGAAIGAPLLDFLIGLALFSVISLIWGPGPILNWLLLPITLLFICLAALGVGTFFAALNVKYRDFKHALPFMIQLGLFATPTIYLNIHANPEQANYPIFRLLVWCNPMSGLIDGLRFSLLGTPWPGMLWGVSAATAMVLFIGGCYYFRRVQDSFSDII